MPIIECDPWREQYFHGVACPDHVVIPTDDMEAYRLFPAHRWVYNKLLICETQQLEHAPHGVRPRVFPVFSKPIYNLHGMGAGIGVMWSADDYERMEAPGHLWMTLLTGEHVSSDVALVKGEAVWWKHAVGSPLPDGAFDRWTLLADARPDLEAYLGGWLGRHLRDYTGMANLETIGGRMIECHLRLADQWVDLHGPGWMQSVVELYATGAWRFDDAHRRNGHSVVLFGDHGYWYRIDQALVDSLRARSGVSSIQVTFHPGRLPERHAMPPGGFRLAVVNCWDLASGLAVRDELAAGFQRTRQVGPMNVAPGGRAA
ncbi:MAG TPA: hypothetical protein VD793_09410 [Gemmatimonadales bacterium]|nr:hypothetical protein [Gemmatimonadales bacterium]